MLLALYSTYHNANKKCASLSVTSYIAFFKVYCDWWSLQLLVHTQRVKDSFVATLSPSEKPMQHLQKWIIKTGYWSTKMTAAKKQNVITLEVKLDMFRLENSDSKGKIG